MPRMLVAGTVRPSVFEKDFISQLPSRNDIFGKGVLASMERKFFFRTPLSETAVQGIFFGCFFEDFLLMSLL